MKFSIVPVVALAGAVFAAPQAVTENVTPTEAAPAGCTGSADGTFEVTIVQLAKRDLNKRSDCSGEGILVMSLKDGVLKDAQGRTGYIASNFQFQFDGPPQAGAIYTGGFSACGNGSLALGGSTTFYQCLSGNFYNLYDRHWAAQCEPIHMNLLECGAGGYVGGEMSDGQIVGTTMVVTTIVTVLSDGQPQVVPTTIPIPMCQIGDGQVQAHTTPCAEIPLPTITATPISQISDGQVQVPPPATGAPAPGTTAPPAVTTAPAVLPSVSAPSNNSAPVSIPTVPTTAAASSTPSEVPVNGAQKFGPSSMVALVVGIAGAMWCL